MGRITAFANRKGGVGKTSSCVNTAACIAETGARVLIVDADPQGNATTGLGCRKCDLDGSVYDVLIRGEAASSHVVPTCVNGLYLLPSNIDLTGAEIELIYHNEYEKRLKSRIDGLKDDFDHIFIDCPPSLGLLTINALVAADGVIIPMPCEYYALEGASQLIGAVDIVKKSLNPSVTFDGILLTMYDGRSLISRQIETEVRSHFGGAVYSTVIPKSVRISEAPSYGVPVTLHDGDCRGAAAYRNFAAEYLTKLKQTP